MPDRPIFLERRSYRFRRLMDAVRLLPFLGLALWMFPLMWPLSDVTVAGASGMSTGTALRYLFGVWFALIVITWLLWRRTRHGRDTATSQPSDDLD